MKAPVLESLFNKVLDMKANSSLLKETSGQVFSCEYSEIVKNSLFYTILLVAPSERLYWILKRKVYLFDKSFRCESI